MGVEDLFEDGRPELEPKYATCEMCGNERIRFVHHVRHPECPNDLSVGCMCAEKMSNDYVRPRAHEEALKSRAGMRSRWLQRKWRISKQGNDWLKLNGYVLTVYRKADGYRYSIVRGERKSFARQAYPDQDAAKLALFDELWCVTEGSMGK